jgi:hypothetical protein
MAATYYTFDKFLVKPIKIDAKDYLNNANNAKK